MADSRMIAAADAAAHRRLLRQTDLQFDFSSVIPPKPVQWPQWLIELGRFLARLQPVFQYVFWGVLALITAAILFFIGREIVRHIERRKGAAQDRKDTLPAWRPPLAKARALLEEADRLAAAGRYGEAVHVLLFRSIEDINTRRPRSLRPDFTSRDIARLSGLPVPARQAFARIAASVEKDFFAGRPIDAGDFAECRKAYENFALKEAWTAA